MANLIEDTRQQKDKHAEKNRWWSAHGDNICRCALPVGDYALFPTVAVDTKASMAEIAQNIGGSSKEHARFRNELIKARSFGCKLYVLIENEDGIKTINEVAFWDNPRLEECPYAITGARLAKAMATMERKYGVTFVFCRPSEAAEKILQLLGSEQHGDGLLQNRPGNF